MNFKERKQLRTKHYEKYVKYWKLRDCKACNGSGYYDDCDSRGNSIKCDCCNGNGKERYLSKLINYEI